ncbi:MAG: T9SS type A sorting domain-containing protein [Flavobacteriales bacterium]|nr:T9SS type A sorting domain-containing protein [Flavobacteriales bacterium]
MLLFIISLLLFKQTNYYISSSDGNDENSGLSSSLAWKTLSKVNTFDFAPGDSILFKTGDEFIGQLFIKVSGADGKPITYASYGDTEKPIINSAPSEGGSFEASVLIRNKSNIIFQDIEVTNNRMVKRTASNADYTLPIQSDQRAFGIHVFNNSDYSMRNLIIRNVTVREVFAITTAGVDFDDLQVAGIFFQSTRTNSPKNINSVLVENCYITLTGKFGIWAQHAGAAIGVGNDSLNRNSNLVFRNNHTYKTGGSGITPGSSYNVLMEGNTFEYPGSDADERMAKRGSGAWFYNCKNVLAQFNKTLHARGPADTYGIHIDHTNTNIFVQYNYTEDSEGGFIEILGNNDISVYRYNVSVNDGIRTNARSLWISDYAGTSRNIRSNNNYIYNNTIFVGSNRNPGILLRGLDTYIFNNLFYVADGGSIGKDEWVNDISAGSELMVSNNLFFGNIGSGFSNLDKKKVQADPLFVDAGATHTDGYQLDKSSPAFEKGLVFSKIPFPNAGYGIFENVPKFPETDLYGNPIQVINNSVTIGAFAGETSAVSIENETKASLNLFLNQNYPNPFNPSSVISFTLQKQSFVELAVFEINGKLISTLTRSVLGAGEYQMQFDGSDLSSGIYLYKLTADGHTQSRMMTIIK